MSLIAPDRTLPKLLLIALLAFVAYVPSLTQPFIEDDYPIIAQARQYGPLTGWADMLNDPVSRVRSTTFVLTHWIEKAVGLSTQGFYATSLALHIINCCLIYALGRWDLIGYRVSGWAAAFFAIHEGHQEAVMWYAAANELLLILFGLLALLCWLVFLETRKPLWYIISFIAFFFALLSKESSLILLPLLLLPVLGKQTYRKRLVWLVPFAFSGLIYGILIIQTRGSSFRFHDQSFVLSAPFWETWSKSFFALLVPWGWLSIAALNIWQRQKPLLLLGLIWISVSFMPYMFVDYVHTIPSRQTYLAGIGLALIVGAALAVFKEQVSRRWITAAVLVIVLVHNVSYLWLVKRKQFLTRAEPTEQLIAFTRSSSGKVFVRCFPRPQLIANKAVEVILNKPQGTLVFDESEARQQQTVATFCFEKHGPR